MKIPMIRLATFLVLATGLARLQTTGPERETVPAAAPAIHRSADVVRAKVERKRAKLEAARSGKEVRPRDPGAAARWRFDQRRTPDGRWPMEELLAGKSHVERMMFARDAGLWDWEWLGPGNIGGRARSFVIHPTDPSIMWLGASGGGIWKTTDSGASWAPLSDFLPSLAVSAIVQDPNDLDVLYAATGEGLYTTTTMPGAGIFKTTNGGANWSQLPTTDDPTFVYINELAHHPTNSGTVFACFARSGAGGEVRRTTDGGTTWSTVLTTYGRASDVKISPFDPAHVLVSSFVVGADTCEVWRSGWGGDVGTWVNVTQDPQSGFPTDAERTEFAWTAGSESVYALADRNNGQIWFSSNAGTTWNLQGAYPALGGQGNHNCTIWVDPLDATRLIIGGVDLYRSINGGILWTRMSSWNTYHLGLSAHADHHALVPHPDWHPLSNPVLYAVNDGGVQVTDLGFFTDHLTSWGNLANGLGITQFYSVATASDGSRILGGAQDNSILRLASSGPESWYQGITGDGMSCAIDPDDPSRMYMTLQFLDFHKSNDGGFTWVRYQSGLGDAQSTVRAAFVAPIAVDEDWPLYVYAGGRSVWSSYNFGSDWGELFAPLPDSSLSSVIETTPHPHRADERLVWVGYRNGHLRRYREQVGFDDPSDPAMPTRRVTDIEISPHDERVVIVSFSGYQSNTLWMTANAGSTWADIHGAGPTALPDVQINTVTFHPTNPDWIYVGNDLGVFASEDRGENWNVTTRYGNGEGPAFVEVTDFAWHSGTTLVAATFGRGMYSCRPLEVVFVDGAHGGSEDGTQANPFDTFGEGIDFIGHGATLSVSSGTYDEGARVIDKRITIRGAGGSAVIR